MMLMLMLTVMLKKKRKRRSRTATKRMDDDKDYCRAVPDWVLYTRRTHGDITATVAASFEREEEDGVVLLSFVRSSSRR